MWSGLVILFFKVIYMWMSLGFVKNGEKGCMVESEGIVGFSGLW